jgi:GBP family porin
VKRFLLAAGGLFTAAAWAQSSVTLYGVADASIQNTGFSRPGAASMTTLNSGHRSGSRWGVRGAEDLGAGLKAIFQLEQGVNLNSGTLGQGGRAFGRQSYVGVDGGFGTFAVGRMSSFHGGAFDMFSPIDSFGTGYGIASMASTFSEAGGLRVDNAILYRTPRLAGFQAGYVHSFQTNGPAAAGTSANTRFDHAGLNYNSGPLYAGLTYSRGKFPAASTFEDQQMLHAGATYDFKVAKLHAAYGIEKRARGDLVSAVGATADGTDAKSWMLGASMPLGPLASKLFASVQKRDGKTQTIGATTFDADRTVYGIGYDYSLSRRTTLYATAAKSKGSGTLAPTRAATDFANKREITMGITHSF